MQEQGHAVHARTEIEQRRAQQKDDARDAHERSGEPQHAVGETLAALDLALVGHVDPLGHEQIRQEQNHPLLVVFGPMANVVVNNVLHTSWCHDALMMGTNTNTTPRIRWLIRNAKTTSGPTMAARGGTNTKAPENINTCSS